nr:MAG TPA: hypothetical protein [Caudoviricetes sp.]
MSKNTTLKQGGQYKRKERHITALLVRVDKIGQDWTRLYRRNHLA